MERSGGASWGLLGGQCGLDEAAEFAQIRAAKPDALYIFLPGFLGAVTLYILLRETYNNLTIKKKWNKTLTALLFIITSLVVIALPLYFAIDLLRVKVSAILSDPVELLKDAKIVGQKVYDLTGVQLLTDENLLAFQKKMANIIPGLLNSSASLLSNFAIMFFLLYFLKQGYLKWFLK